MTTKTTASIVDSGGRRFVRAAGRKTVTIEHYVLHSWRHFHKLLTRLSSSEIRRCLDREWSRSKTLGGPRRSFLLRLTVRLGELDTKEKIDVIKANVPVHDSGHNRPRLTCDELQNKIDALLPIAETKTHWATIRRWTRLLKERQPAEIMAIAAISKDRKRYPLPEHAHIDDKCPYDACPPEAV